MKLRIFFAVLLVAGAWIAGRAYINRGGERYAASAAPAVAAEAVRDAGATERVINESFKLAPGARVSVSGIHGPVEIKTAEGDEAVVNIALNAPDARNLARHKITVRQTEDGGLNISAVNNEHSIWGWLAGRSAGRVNHRVELRLPRRVELRASGINGHLNVGVIEGAVKLSGINGPVNVARAGERADLSGINGPVTVGLSALAGEGVRVSGINGPVELRFSQDANADVSVSGLNGSVTVDNPRISVEEEGRARFNGRVGAGGTPVRLSGIHGNVTLSRG